MSVILNGLKNLLVLALSLLPDSPFREFLDGLAGLPYLGYLNWFIPVGDFVRLLSVWCVAVGVFYVASVILRFVKAIN